MSLEGCEQGCSIAVIPESHVCAAGQQELHYFDATARRSQGERSLAGLVWFVHLNAQLYEHLDQRQTVPPYGDMEKGFSCTGSNVQPWHRAPREL
jgi:hypothetical protein